jgi:hypothetical protein
MDSINQLRITKTGFEVLITSMFPDDKADVFAKLLQHIIIIKGDLMYSLKDSNIYVCEVFDSDKFLSIITEVLRKSFNSLSDNEKTTLQNHRKVKCIFENSSVKKYLPQLKVRLTMNSISFDTYFNEIHFLNGYMSLKTMEFKQREFGKHFITKTIQRQYKEPSANDKKIIEDCLKKIVPDKEDLKTILMTFGSALSGYSTTDQDLLILLGEGSAGKSFLLELTSLVVECYFKELKDDTFSLANSKIDKIMNSFANDPQIRYSWINEPKDTKWDDSVMKTFCDGKLQTTKLYNEGSHTIQHFSKPILTMNVMPNVKSDSGIARRLKGYEHKSKFVDDAKDVDESKHIYLKDKLLLTKYKAQPQILNAFFQILATHCKLWLDGESITYSKNFHDTKNNVISSNDHIQDFVDFRLKITNTENDRIGKDDMLNLYREKFPNKFLTMQQLISLLKSKNIKYNSDFRVNNVKGAFYCVKVIDDLDREIEQVENEETEKEQIVNENKKLKEKLAMMEKQMEELKKQLEQKQEVAEVKINKDLILDDLERDLQQLEQQCEPVEHVRRKVIKRVNGTKAKASESIASTCSFTSEDIITIANKI